MALTESNMLPIGTIAPDFSLIDTVSDKVLSVNELFSDKATIVMFICNHCPYVIHVKDELVRLAHDYQPKGVKLVAISSNDIEKYPQDGPEAMKEFARENGFTFPYLYDETQEVARAYDAACTPDFYIFDGKKKLRYRGRLDESRPRVESPKPVTGKDLRGALNAILANQMISEIQFPSMGCNIKWKN
ncbi:thioredoxin family protein [Emticicia aquatilis]|uniref:Thioredoxin family protein n=1 Tax=Emticicia aquatilis TaxID=1537369 RepID=A0A917DV22_9BACT|nr:thioredoxin family protein [Emticicia aquatilis]GGD70090.1 thioredoxin family protein [Emticicia aquatilis]